ncbi:LON peptidase substrate-binding domain-containing protein [Mycobacterium sp.]|uniref:LON peptidase substrate-binding domain-containing protein n=1 Tax=Mycobacterium sp. TaxID=1785 RepID=UPI00127AF29E|nr:LON peptidase substrate-binding domain-containing protein [Mycobacterium sp.]KAA8966896.1 MAG: ATP-dependent protease [Mycobacterium sp.]
MIGPGPVPLAMFPLESALLPGEDLPLRVFEPRYVALVQDCLHSAEPQFGVVLISRGREVGGGEVRCDVGALARIAECIDQGDGRYVLRCRMGERIRVDDWLPDQPYPRAMVRAWPDEPGPVVRAEQLRRLEDQLLALFERIAAARGARLPGREVLLGSGDDADAGTRLYSLASRVPVGPADRYKILAAPSAAQRLAALRDALESIAAVVEFQLSQ